MAGLSSKMDTAVKEQERALEKELEEDLQKTMARADERRKALATMLQKKQLTAPMEVDTGGAAASSSVSPDSPFGKTGEAGVGAAVPPKKLASGYAIASWPKPPCDACCAIGDTYKQMSQEHQWVEGLEDWIIKYTCTSCSMLKWDMTRGQALQRMKEERGDIAKGKKRAELYQAAAERHSESFEFKEASRKGKRTILRNELLIVFKPIMSACITKRRQLKVRGELNAEHTALCERLGASTNLTEIEDLLEQIEKIEDGIKEASQPLGFKSLCKTEEDAFRFMMAASYCDSWSEIRNANGRLLGGFCAFFICRAGGTAHPCNSLIISKIWGRNHEDILACSQSWKCCCCGANYKTRMGMLVQTMLVGSDQPLYALAKIMNDDVKDLKTLTLENALGDKVRTPEDLYRLIPEVLPVEGRFIRKAVASDYCKWLTPPKYGVYKILEYSVLATCPVWDWTDVQRFFSGDDDCSTVEC
jgi:hypothetical protein